MQTNDYYLIEIVTWNQTILHKLIVLDKNTWKYTTKFIAKSAGDVDFFSAEG